ncbi:MAG: hypothetical protein EOO43_26225, partial [Flavobacterium sp.]
MTLSAPEPLEIAISLVKELGKFRQIPQLFFVDEIRFESLFKLRETVLDFKEHHSDISEIDFIINSPGGGPDEAYKMVRTLRNNFETVNVIVPFWAKSAATLLALGGSCIIMDEFAEFGPIDVQLVKERDDSPFFERESALNDEYSLKLIEDHSQLLFEKMFTNFYQNQRIPVNKNDLSSQVFEYLAKFYDPLLSQINPYKLGDKKRKLEIGEQYAAKILELYQKDVALKERVYLTDFLVNGCPDHGYVIDYYDISTYMPSVVKLSSKFGLDFKKALSNLSGFLMSLEKDIRYTGFVDFQVNTAAQDSPPHENGSEGQLNHGNVQV